MLDILIEKIGILIFAIVILTAFFTIKEINTHYYDVNLKKIEFNNIASLLDKVCLVDKPIIYNTSFNGWLNISNNELIYLEFRHNLSCTFANQSILVKDCINISRDGVKLC